MKDWNSKIFITRVFIASFVLNCLGNYSTANAKSALDAIEDAKSAADTMRSAAKAIEDKYEAINSLVTLGDYYIEANENFKIAEADLKVAENSVVENEKYVAESQGYLAEAKAREEQWGPLALNGSQREEELRKQIEEAQKLVEQRRAEETSLQARYRSITGISASNDTSISEAVLRKMLEEAGYDENKLEEIEQQLGIGGRANEGVDVTQVWSDLGLNTIYNEISAADTRYYQLLEELEMITDAQQQAHTAAEDVKLLTTALEESLKYLQDAQNDLTLAKENLRLAHADLDELKRDIREQKSLFDTSRTFWRFGSSQVRHYSWKGGNSKGRQTEIPLSFYMGEGKNEYGISGYYVFSNHQGLPNGNINTIGELTLSYAKRQDYREDLTVRYLFGMRVPVGKSKIHRNTIMHEDLVPHTRYNYGLDFLPGISVIKRFGERDSLTYTTTYSIRGNYKYDVELPDTKVNPSNEWGHTLQWLHAGKKWQLLATTDFTINGKTDENGLRYREGQDLSAGIYYNRVLSPKHDVMVYYRYVAGGKTSYYTPITWDAGGSENQRFYGIQWQNTMDQRNTFRLMYNVMRTSGSNYDPITYLSSDSRKRHGLTANYEYALSANTSLSFEWEIFRLKVDGTSTKYKGNNFYLTFSKNF